MSIIKSICVYCASGPGNNPAFMEAASRFGRILAENGIRLVYGGGAVGLMGALAESVLDHGGLVTGVIPDFLVNREHMLARVQERIITPDMHERKRVMFERADAFVALPGGVGTLEELVEQLTWAQLGRHKKPILILNVARFWDPLCVLLDDDLVVPQGDDEPTANSDQLETRVELGHCLDLAAKISTSEEVEMLVARLTGLSGAEIGDARHVRVGRRSSLSAIGICTRTLAIKVQSSQHDRTSICSLRFRS